jgi:hypothetical protein
MNAFLLRHADSVLGVLSGFDRLVFRGHLRALSYAHGMDCYRSANRILLKDFAAYAQRTSARLIEASLADAQSLGRQVRYLNSPNVRKEDVARQIAAADRISDGLICVLSCVEPCLSFEVHRSRERKRLEIQSRPRKCLHLYHYFLHPVFGFMHARIQTWFPFAVQICLNGREWLARMMDQEGIGYVRRDNCFTASDDLKAAQELFDQQLCADWPALRNGVLLQVHPAHPELLGRLPHRYYFSAHQSEWASDCMFRDRAGLEAIYPLLVRHALTTFDSACVMRFLGRAVPSSSSGQVNGNFQGEVHSDGRRRSEGVRVKHSVKGNSVKVYDKGSVLRVETTINEPHEFKVYRAKEGEPQGEKDWRVLRKGIADLHRRAEVSQACNGRYAEALAAVSEKTPPLREVAGRLCRAAVAPGGGKVRRMVRGLNPLSGQDGALLRAVARPEWVVSGLRNKDVARALYGDEPARDDAQRRRRASRVTRQLRMLRAHGLLRKVPRSHRYQVSDEGRKAITALLAAADANAETLTVLGA